MFYKIKTIIKIENEITSKSMKEGVNKLSEVEISTNIIWEEEL